MNMAKNILIALSLLVIIMSSSCSKDSNTSVVIPSSVKALIDGGQWASSVITTRITTISVAEQNNSVIIIDCINLDESVVRIQIPMDNFIEESYTFTETSLGSITYIPVGMTASEAHSSTKTNGQFSLTISNIDVGTGTLNATFAGTLLNDSDGSISIAEGFIKNIRVYNLDFYSNGTMGLQRNDGLPFEMDTNELDGRYVFISQDNAANSLTLFGMNNNQSANAGIYTVAFPLDVVAGTYNLTSENFRASISNTGTDEAYSLTSGTLTITSHADNNIIGTFSYTMDNGTTTVVISNGSLDIKYN